MQKTSERIAAGIELLGWNTETPAGTMRMAEDLKLLAECQLLTQLEAQVYAEDA